MKSIGSSGELAQRLMGLAPEKVAMLCVGAGMKVSLDPETASKKLDVYTRALMIAHEAGKTSIPLPDIDTTDQIGAVGVATEHELAKIYPLADIIGGVAVKPTLSEVLRRQSEI